MKQILLIGALVAGLFHNAVASDVDLGLELTEQPHKRTASSTAFGSSDDGEVEERESALITSHPPSDDKEEEPSTLGGDFGDEHCETIVCVLASYLSFKDLINLCCLNSLFKEIVSSGLVLNLSRSAKLIDATYLKKLPQSLVALNLSKCSKLTPLDLSPFSRLTSLNLSGCWLNEVVCLPKSLTHLDVSWCSRLTVPDLSPFSRLTSLNLSKCWFSKVVCLPKSLTHLDVSWCSRLKSIDFDWEGLRHLNLLECCHLKKAISSSPNLTYLGLGGLGFVDEDLQRLFPNLTSLDLDKNFITSQVLDTLPKGLTHLGLRFEGPYNTVRQTTLKNHRDFPQSITSLSLLGGENMTDQLLKILLQNFPNLTSLSLPNCWCVTDKGLADLAQSLSNLTHLNLSWCVQITDKGLMDLAQSLTNLTHLDLSGCWNFANSKVLAPPLQNLPALTYLNLIGIGDLNKKVKALRAQGIEVKYYR